MRASKKGFTLAELLLAFVILTFCLSGILLSYVNMYFLSDLSRDITRSNAAAQDKMEEAKKTSFADISALNGATFDITGFTSANAKGRIEVSDVTIRGTPTETMKRVRISVCFKSGRRVVGEDKNLNGTFDGGEDTNGNGLLDAPVELVTLISR